MAAATSITTNNSPGVFVVGDCVIDPGSIAGGAEGSQTIAIAGVKTTDLCSAAPIAALDDGLVISQVACLANDTITIKVENHTGGALDAASATWNWSYMRGVSANAFAG